jgi:hypothetical protein
VGHQQKNPQTDYKETDLRNKAVGNIARTKATAVSQTGKRNDIQSMSTCRDHELHLSL